MAGKRGMRRLTQDELAARKAEAWERYVAGETQKQIGDSWGLDQSTVSAYIGDYRKTLPKQSREQLVEKHQAGVAWATKKLRELANMQAPPVTAGKDGDIVRDPTVMGPDGKPAIVRDYGAQMAAIRELRGWQDREAKLAGLDAAAKVEHSGNVTIEGTVDQELRKLSEQLGLIDAEMPIAEDSSLADGR